MIGSVPMSKPDPSTSNVSEEVARRTIAGARWVMILNLSTFPLSFFTNAILGRVSPRALGAYGAIALFAGMISTFVIIGGPKVFTRFVPVIDRRDRFPFLLTYSSIVLALMLAIAGLAIFVYPASVPWALGRFGEPPLGLALFFALTVALVGFLNHFLWGVLEAARAAITLRAIVVGFFLCAVLGLGPLKRHLAQDPVGFLWLAAPTIYASAVILGAVFVARTKESREPGRLRWFLPAGFWEVVLFTYLESLIVFVYSSLSPVLVLFWLDVTSLGYLHAALRWVVLLDTIPSMLTVVLSPGLARLQAAGEQEEGLRQAAAVMKASVLVSCPVVLVLTFFAPQAMAVFGPEFRSSADLLRILAPIGLAGSVIHLGSGMLVALGAVRAYLLASIAYVLAALGLTFGLIPSLGLIGAALAATLGAWLNQLVVATVLRARFGFRIPGRIHVAWACCGSATLSAWGFDPGWIASAALCVLFLGVFAFAGRVSRHEIVTAVRRLAGRR